VASLSGRYADRVSLLVLDGLDDEFVRQGYSVLSVGQAPTGRMDRFIRGSKMMFFAIRKLKPKVVHFHDPELIFLCLLLKLMNYSIVYDVHEDIPRQIRTKHYLAAPFRISGAFMAAIVERLAARCFDGVVTATEIIAARFPANRTYVVRNYPSLSEFTNSNYTLSVSCKTRSFLYIGGITRVRGVENMLEAIARLNTHEKVSLSLAGQFQPLTLEQELSLSPQWAYVDFSGWVGREEIVKLLRNSQAGLVLLHPLQSYIESLPVKLFEYMAAGLPVIASDFPPWREIVAESNAGILVDPMNVDAIADAMQWILDNPEESRQMGVNGCDAVAKKYNWEQETNALFELYDRLLPSN